MSLSKKFRQVRLDTPSIGHAVVSNTQVDDSQEMLCSQEFLCTQDFVTPVEQQFSVDFNVAKENVNMSVTLIPLRSKRPRQDVNIVQLKEDELHYEQKPVSLQEPAVEDATQSKVVIPSAALAAVRQRVMSPPCIKNPFLDNDNFQLHDICGRSRQGCHHVVGASCQSRYHEEFHEIQEIGRGNFSCVFKVLKRIDGCFYAVKRSHRSLQQDGERRRALREVQALACLGLHENVVRYFSSWFENDFLYIQMELCDTSLRNREVAGPSFGEKSLLEAMWQLLKALNHIHSHGIVHLDLKPDNIYVQEGAYKIGDFGSATRMDASMSIEEGDARYLPLELINDEYGELQKADMFSLGATFYELARGSPLTSSGSQFHALRQGKLALLPGFSLAFQSLLKALMHPDPRLRPSAAEALKNSIFCRTM